MISDAEAKGLITPGEVSFVFLYVLVYAFGLFRSRGVLRKVMWFIRRFSFVFESRMGLAFHLNSTLCNLL